MNSSNKAPRFSIIVPVYNLADYISETLSSILRQEVEWEFEVIVVDDASSDSSLAICQEWERKDLRVRVLKNSRSKGVSGARNTGLVSARGDWICFLDGDDLWTPNHLAAKATAITQVPDVDLLTSDFAFFYPDDDFSLDRYSSLLTKIHFTSMWREIFSEAISTCQPQVLLNPLDWFLRKTILVCTGVVTARREVVNAAGFFDESLHRGEDDHYWLRLASASRNLVFIPEILFLYRQRPDSATRGNQDRIYATPIVYKRLLSDRRFSEYRPLMEARISEYLYLNSIEYRSRRQRLSAIYAAAESIYWEPRSLPRWRNFLGALLLRD